MQMKNCLSSLSLLVLASNLAWAQSSSHPHVRGAAPAYVYEMVDLNSNPTFPDFQAYGLSNNGRLVGVATDQVSGNIHGIMWVNGVFQDLGDYGYPYGSDASAVNDIGQVLGTGYGPGYHAIRWFNGTVTHLGSIDGGYSAGLSMNSSGNIVGRAVNGDGGGQGFSYINGQFNALSVDIARGINDANEYVGSVGYYWTYGGYVHSVEHGFVFANGVSTDIGDIGGGLRTYTECFAINDAHQVTGYSTAADGTQHAFLYQSGTLTDLGTLAPYWSCGLSINNSGVIVGSLDNAYGVTLGSFVYANGTMRDVTDVLGPAAAGWSQITVSKINDQGWMIGTGTLASDGLTHSFLARTL